MNTKTEYKMEDTLNKKGKLVGREIFYREWKDEKEKYDAWKYAGGFWVIHG